MSECPELQAELLCSEKKQRNHHKPEVKSTEECCDVSEMEDQMHN